MKALSILSRTLVLLIVLSLPAAAQHAPAVWQLKDEDSTVYLLGTIHLLKPDTPWFTDEMRALFAGADSLTVEVATDRIEPMAMQQTLMAIGYYPPGESLDDHLPEPLYTRLLAEAQKVGLPGQAVERMRPWLVGLTLTSALAAQAGFLPQYGVDAVLMGEARAAGKPVHELETVEEQLALFAGLSDEAQAAWIEEGLEQIADIQGFFERMKSAWLDADTEALERILSDGLERNPELADRLLYARNRNWIPRIEALLDAPGRHFVAVGAGHLTGKESVIGLLEDAGYAVERY